VVQVKCCIVSAIGLREHEIRLVKSILGHSNERNPTCYEWADVPSQAHVVMVSSDNEDAMKTWQALAPNRVFPVLLLITPRVQDCATEYCLPRPFSPSKLIIVLDKIIKERLASVLETKIFAGDSNLQQRETVVVHGGVSSARRALVVDDSPTVCKQLELELGAFNIQVEIAETGEQCLAVLDKHQYDIIFLDVVMPGADGYEVCKNIRKNSMTKRTPVIMLTSKSSSFDRVRGTLAGCNAYLTKPVDYEKFHKVLEDYLQ